ncbi:peptidyl-prolyl cis-trans isomerase G-like [Stegodyphus dumicola]|uniref:peptidyl-prolyl cis-trans isomerase G-like n=1 Tax=Stegodyphus dumicola TaxID=202533 RepID=UPI0015B37AB4|nr:peptidyl-prolyl cis-trans isomerase G-like [Stegodyphus dumicola]
MRILNNVEGLLFKELLMDSDNMCADKDGFIPETIDSSKKCQVDDCSSFHSNSTELPMDSWIGESDVLALKFEHDNVNSDLESELKKAEIELLAELEKVELEEKQRKEEHEAKYKSLLEEVERLKQSDLQKDAKISELTELAKSLKRNLCSLYKTAKFEIERKDSLLQEAHKQLDRVLNQSRKVNVQAERKYSHPCEASNLKEKSCSKNSSNHINKSEASVTVENSCNRNSSSNTDKFEGNNPKKNPCPKNSTSHSDKTNNRKYGSHQTTVSIERDSSSRSDYRNHTKTSTSEAKSSHRDTYNHRSHHRHNSDSRKDTKHENAEKRKDHHHKSSTQPTHSDNNISSLQDKQRDSKCDERKLHGEKDHSSSQNSRHNLGKQTLQKDISKSAQVHINETAQKTTKCKIQRSSTEKLASVCASRKRSSSQNPSSHQDSRHSSEKQTFQKDMSEPAQSHMNEISEKIMCETKGKSSEKLTLACTSRKCSSSRNASPGRDARHHSEKHTFQKNISESAQVLMNEISLKTAESSIEIQEKSSEKLELACTSRKRSLSRNASVQTNELDGTSRDLTETNSLFYNILPNTLKDSFNEYEQKQITTLNKLKQSFVNYYIESQDRSKRSRTSFKFPCDFTADTLGVSSSEQFRSPFPEIGYMPKADDIFPDNIGNQIGQTNAVGESTKTKMKIVTKSEILEKSKEDILKLYHYQNSKVPFLVKRKFGLLNNSKKN